MDNNYISGEISKELFDKLLSNCKNGNDSKDFCNIRVYEDESNNNLDIYVFKYEGLVNKVILRIYDKEQKTLIINKEIENYYSFISSKRMEIIIKKEANLDVNISKIYGLDTRCFILNKKTTLYKNLYQDKYYLECLSDENKYQIINDLKKAAEERFLLENSKKYNDKINECCELFISCYKNDDFSPLTNYVDEICFRKSFYSSKRTYFKKDILDWFKREEEHIKNHNDLVDIGITDILRREMIIKISQKYPNGKKSSREIELYLNEKLLISAFYIH